MQCPVCGEAVDPDEQRLRSSVFIFCCEACAPQVRHTFAEERDRRTTDPEAA